MILTINLDLDLQDITLTDLIALVTRCESRKGVTGVYLDDIWIDGDRDDLAQEALRAVFVDPEGPAWLAERHYVKGWMVDFVPERNA